MGRTRSEGTEDRKTEPRHTREEILANLARCFCSNVLPVATFAETQAVFLRLMSVDRGLDGLDGLDGGGRCGCGASFRLRGRRLRMHLRHEQLSIRMAVESALHHSCQRPYRPLIDAAVQTCTWIDTSSNKSDENDALSSVTNLSPHINRTFCDFHDTCVPSHHGACCACTLDR